MSELLPEKVYMSFPFRITANGAAGSGRAAHIREQIEQVLFTNPNERVFRPEFGAGLQKLVFELNTSPTHEIATQKLMASLSEALLGEVDPKSLDIQIYAEPNNQERLMIEVSYTLAAIGHQETHRFQLSPSSQESD